MKLVIVCRDVGGERTWEEEYSACDLINPADVGRRRARYERIEVTNIEEAKAYSEELIEAFNNTCRANEKKREIVSVRLDD